MLHRIWIHYDDRQLDLDLGDFLLAYGHAKMWLRRFMEQRVGYPRLRFTSAPISPPLDYAAEKGVAAVLRHRGVDDNDRPLGTRQLRKKLVRCLKIHFDRVYKVYV